MSPQEPNDPIPLISTARAAKILHVTTRSIQRWAGEGLIPSMKIDGLRGPYVFDARVIEDVRLDGLTRNGLVVVQASRRSTDIAS